MIDCVTIARAHGLTSCECTCAKACIYVNLHPLGAECLYVQMIGHKWRVCIHHSGPAFDGERYATFEEACAVAREKLQADEVIRALA